MWYLVYNLVLFVTAPLVVLTLMVKKRCRRGLLQRMGIGLPVLEPAHQPVLWIHAVSLGEVLAVIPLVLGLRARYPFLKMRISTVTETGREAVEQRLSGIADHCYLPLDWPWTVLRYVRWIRPAAFIFVETELWPNLLRCLHRHGVPTILVNGRLSSRSFRNYRLIRGFMTRVLSTVSLCLVQSDRDLQRMTQLGMARNQVHRTGNMKFDQGQHWEVNGIPRIKPGSIGLALGEELIVAGSTHAEEEEALLRCYERVCREYPTVVLLLAPRHIERADRLENRVQAYGMKVVRRSRIQDQNDWAPSAEGPRVIILDSRGELASVYSWAWVAFVGGTLVPIGGHNLLEPAGWGKPVFFGPFTDHCREIAGLLLQGGGGVQVQNGEELAELFLKSFRNRDWTEQMGQAAREIVREHQGVVPRNLEFITKVLDTRMAQSQGTFVS